MARITASVCMGVLTVCTGRFWAAYDSAKMINLTDQRILIWGEDVIGFQWVLPASGRGRCVINKIHGGESACAFGAEEQVAVFVSNISR